MGNQLDSGWVVGMKGVGRKRNFETEGTGWHRGCRPERDWPVFKTEKRPACGCSWRKKRN